VFDGPSFCLTADVDWASEYSLGAFLELAESRGIKPTVFATHKSEVLDSAVEHGTVEIGVHPNFAPGSTHGSTTAEVVAHVFDLYPSASTYRSHRMIDGAEIQTAMAERGIAYDSNLGLYLQASLVPLQLASGLIRFPIFWSDDTHFRLDGGNWELDSLLPAFLTPGLKVLDVHPTNLAINARSLADYEAVRPFTQTLDERSALSMRSEGEGAGSFMSRLLDHLVETGYRFRTLRELFDEYRNADDSSQRSGSADEGRTTRHTRAEFDTYWSISDAERQAFMRESYRRRNPRDPYATSRDVNLRDLEIEAITQVVEPETSGPLIDLGCGNGLTLLRLASRLPRLKTVGVDFTPELIEGAEYLTDELLPGAPRPEFVCADAFEYLAALADGSVSQILTERFVMNLPSSAAQERLLASVERVLEPAGRLVMCEASESGFAALNDVRESLGLERVAGRSEDNVSVIRFDDDEFERWMHENLGLVVSKKLGFSDFFLISRAIHPALVAPRPPRFDAPINAMARALQEATVFRPGYGANVVWVFEREA
jgi:SAM-dependent methyltransferase